MKRGEGSRTVTGRHHHSNPKRAKKRGKFHAPLVVAEPLERRMFLSVSAATLVGPWSIPGSVFNFTGTATGPGATGSETLTKRVVGMRTAPTGQTAVEIDQTSVITITTSSGTHTVTDTFKGWYQLTSAGAVQYAKEDTSANGSVTDDTYSPPKVSFPATLTAGQTVTEDTTDTSVITDTDGTTTTSTTDNSVTITLDSETPQLLTVAAGTFSVYKITFVTTNTIVGNTETPTPTTNVQYWSPQVGLVEDVSNNEASGTAGTLQLSNFSIPGDTLQFVAQPVDTPQGQTIPAVSVEFLNNGVLDTQNTSPVTLTIQGGDGTLSGTTTVNAVNGIATFDDLSVDTPGSYTLVASSSATTATATSNSFNITAPLVWTGNGDGINWSDPMNWEQDQAPTGGDNLLFPGGAPLSPNNDIAGLSISSIDIEGSGYTLTGNAISLTGSLISEAGNNTYNINTTLVGSPTVDDQTGDLTIQSVLSGGGLTVAGSGAVTFDQVDSYTGATTLSAGVTIDDTIGTGAFGDNTITIGAGTAPVTINATGGGTVTIHNDIILQDGSTLANDPELVSDGRVTINGRSALAPTGSSDQQTYDGSMFQGTGTLSIKGNGKVQIQGDLSSTVQLMVVSGELDLGANLRGELNGTSQVVVNGGTLKLLPTLGGSGGIDVKNGTLLAGGESGYDGTITLEQGGFDPLHPERTNFVTVKVTPSTDALGFGKLMVVGPSAILPVSLNNLLLVNASGNQNTLTLNNVVELDGRCKLTTSGSVVFGNTITVQGDDTLNTLASTDVLKLPDTSILETSAIGFLTIDGPGKMYVQATIPSDVSLVLGGETTGSTGTLFLVDLQAALDNTTQVIVNRGILQLLPGILGEGGIDMKGGTLNAPGGASIYGGTITLEEGGATAVIVNVTPGVDDLGMGQVIVVNTSATFGQLFNSDSVTITNTAGNQQTATIDNAVTFQSQTDNAPPGANPSTNLIVSGDLTFTTALTFATAASGAAVPHDSISMMASTDHLTLTGGIVATGSSFVDIAVTGSGTLVVNGVISEHTTLSFTTPSALSGELDLGANLLGSPGGTASVFMNGGTVKMLQSLSGGGGIFMISGDLMAGGTSRYQGNIDLDQNGGGLDVLPVAQSLRIFASPAVDTLGTGTLRLRVLRDFLYTLINTSGNQQTLSLNNPLFLDGGGTFKVAGSVTFNGVLTRDIVNDFGVSNLTTTQDGDVLTLNGGIQGQDRGTNIFGPGLITINGDVAAGIHLNIGDTPADSNEVDLGANLLGPILAPGPTANPQIKVQAGILKLLSFSRTGGIDVAGGTLVTNTTGSTGYGGTVILDSGTIKDLDASDDKGLGTGTLVLNGGLLQNSSGGLATLDNQVNVEGPVTISSRSQRLKFAGGLLVDTGGSLDIRGNVVVTSAIDGSGPITLNGGLFAVTTSNPTFTGNVTVTSGVVEVTANDSLGLGPSFANLQAQDQGVLQSPQSIGDPVLHNHLTVQSGTLIVDGEFTFPNGITIDPGATLEILGATTQVVVSGPLDGGGNVLLFNGGNFSTPGGTSGFTGTIQTQSGKVTPILTVSDAGGVSNGSPFPATYFLDGPALQPAAGLEGVTPTLTYFIGSTASGTSSSTAPTNPGTYTVVGSFAGTADYNAVESNPVTFTILSSVPTQPTIVQDIEDKGNQFTGRWWYGTLPSGLIGNQFLNDGNQSKGLKSVQFNVNLPAAGTYDVAFWIPVDSRNVFASNVPIDVVAADGVHTVMVNEQQTQSGWLDLGTFSFGVTGAVIVRNASTTHMVLADAVKFMPVDLSPNPAPPLNFAAAPASKTSVHMSWTEVATNLTGFLIQQSSDGGNTWTTAGTAGPTATKFTVNGLTAGTTYFFRIQAQGASDDSTFVTSGPIQLAAANSIVKQVGDSGVVLTGRWWYGSNGSGYGSQFLNDGNQGKGDKSVSFNFDQLTSGSYDVSLWIPAGLLPTAGSVPVDIVTASGTTTVMANEQSGGWLDLGSFTPGSTAAVVIRTNGTSGFVVANAVRLTPG